MSSLPDSAARISLIHQLFEQCSHREQLELLDNLSLYLKRDFLALLPSELVERILSYLDIISVLGSCVRVSKVWYHRVRSCEVYWKNLCNSFHLCKEVIKKEKELLGLYSEVAVKWLKLNYSLRKRISCLNVVIHEKELEGEASFDFIAVDPICNGYCIKVSKGTSPSLSLLKKKGTIFCNCALIKDVFPSGLFEVIWCRSTPTNVLLHGNNAVWIEFSFSCRDPQSPPVITEWENDAIISNTYNVFTRCADCLLVVVMEKNKYSDDQKLWSIEFLELRKNPVRVYHYKGFISEFELKDNIPSKVYKTHIYCKGTCGGVFCKEHYILIQFGFSIVLFRITRSEGSSSAALLDGPFSLSHDKTLLCLLTKDYSKTRGQLCVSIRSHIWNLESDSYSILEVMDVST